MGSIRISAPAGAHYDESKLSGSLPGTAMSRLPPFLSAVLCAALSLLLPACAPVNAPPSPASVALLHTPAVRAEIATINQYKSTVARQIAHANADVVTPGRPQAMLRSVVVVDFKVDGDGRVVTSSVYRTNGDDIAEHIALASLRRAGTLPPPPPALLDRHGELELMEDWLFNDDGHFQLRSIAAPQYGVDQQ